MMIAMRVIVAALVLTVWWSLAAAQEASAPGAAYRGLICRGVEESGRLFIGQPGFGPHLVSLFVTGPNPLSATQTLIQHVAWVNDPLHSYVADGTGGMVVWAHPGRNDAKGILALPGLVGIEVHYTGDGSSRDALWDEVLRGCYEAKRPFLWGFAADDTHSRSKINLSWYAARVAKMDEFSLKAALRQGAFYLSNAPTLSDLAVHGKTITLTLDEEAEVLWLRGGQYLSARPTADVTVSKDTGENRCLRWDKAVRTASLKVDDLGLTPGELKFVRAVVRTAPDKVALTQPWRLRDDGTLENPYPPAGEWVRGQTHNHTDTGPGGSNLLAYRLAYQEKGQRGSFSTDYSYWESPYQWLPSDGTPQIESVPPDRCTEGQAPEVIVRGVNFGDKPTVQLSEGTVHRALRVMNGAPTEIRLRLPADLTPGVYDLCVTNPRNFRDCLAQGFTVQSRQAKNEGWRLFTRADGLAYPHCTSAACFGNQVWVGTIVGVYRYEGGKWAYFGREIPGWGAYGMTADPGGGVWIAGGNGLAFCNARGEWSQYKVGQEEKATAGRAMERWGRLAFDRTGQLWVTNRWSAGLGLRKDGQWQRLTKADGLPADYNSAVACDARGVVWVGFAGLYSFQSGQWVKVSLPAPLGKCSFVSALAPAPDGSMWAAVTADDPALGGVVRFQGEKAEVHTLANSPLPSPRLRDILVGRNGDVWFASDYGVARLDRAGRWDVFTSVNSGLGCNIVQALAEDGEGRLWFATAEGVSSLK